jgi:hypothetical protein
MPRKRVRATRLEPAHELTPEAIFEMRWAHAVLEQTLAGLRVDFIARGKQRLFDGLASFDRTLRDQRKIGAVLLSRRPLRVFG